MPPSFLQVSWELSSSVQPLFNYTSIPLDTTQCTGFTDTCSAMRAIVDNLNALNELSEENEMCTLSADCLTITCVEEGLNGLRITVALSPCDSAVTVSLAGGPFDFSQKFTESGVGALRVFGQTAILIDVTLARLQDGAAVGLQVSETDAHTARSQS